MTITRSASKKAITAPARPVLTKREDSGLGLVVRKRKARDVKKVADEVEVKEERPAKKVRTSRVKKENGDSDAEVKLEKAVKKTRKIVSKTDPDAALDPAAAKKRATASVTRKERQIASLGLDPFPTFPHPSAEVAQAVNAALVKLHGRPRRPVKAPPSAEVTDSSAACGQVQSVVEALVRTILSQNTTNANSSKAWRALANRFRPRRKKESNEEDVKNDEAKIPVASVDPDEADRWDQILFAPVEDVADAIRCGGLANNKAKSIHNMLRDVKDKYGVVSLDHLHGKSDEDAMRELVGFSGVGPKTASCVLLFCLRRESFAVDTHVYRISRALNWVPQKANREQAQAHLDVRIPEDIKHSLHCLLVTHGKSCKDCAANGRLSKPDSGPCPLIPFLRGARKGAQGEGGDVPPEPSDETGAEGMEESRADEEVVGADGEVKEEEDVKGVVDAETEDEHLKEEHGYHGL